MDKPTETSNIPQEPAIPNVKPPIEQDLIEEKEVFLPSTDPITTAEVDDADPKKMLSVKLGGNTHQALDHLAKALNITKTEVVEMSVALFYRHYFEREACQLPDLQVFIEELSALVQEHSEMASDLVELSVTMVDAEAELPSKLLRPNG